MIRNSAYLRFIFSGAILNSSIIRIQRNPSNVKRNSSTNKENESKKEVIIDVWGQHPNIAHFQDPVFDNLRHWTKSFPFKETPPVSSTLSALDKGGIQRMLISAWYAPHKVMYRTI